MDWREPQIPLRNTAILLLAALIAGAGGCSNSAYHRARGILPAERSARVELRVREATDTARELLDQSGRIAPALTPASRRTAWERIEPLAWELDRRTLAIEDSLGRTNPPPPHGPETLAAFRAAANAGSALAAALESTGNVEDLRLRSNLALRDALAAADRFRTAQ